MEDTHRLKEIIIDDLNQSMYQIILDYSSDPIFCFNAHGEYMYVNNAFARPMSLVPGDIIGKRIWDIFPGEAGDMRFAAVKRSFETGEQVVLEVKVDTPAKPLFFITTVTPVKDRMGKVHYVICISKEITERKVMEDAIHKAKIEAESRNEEQNKLVKELYLKSITDGLTTLFNRQYMMEKLEEQAESFQRTGRPLFLLLMDLDFFKPVNDTYGHHIGDEVLVEISQCLRTVLNGQGILGRYGGEEFIAILDISDANQAYEKAERLRSAVESQLFSQKRLGITLSIGLASYAGGELKELVRKADDLLYLAKDLGRNRVCR